jgi:hypothetical protein
VILFSGYPLDFASGTNERHAIMTAAFAVIASTTYVSQNGGKSDSPGRKVTSHVCTGTGGGSGSRGSGVFLDLFTAAIPFHLQREFVCELFELIKVVDYYPHVVYSNPQPYAQGDDDQQQNDNHEPCH